MSTNKKNVLFSFELTRTRENYRTVYPEDHGEKIKKGRDFLIAKYGEEFVNGFDFWYNRGEDRGTAEGLKYSEKIEIWSYTASNYGRQKAGIIKRFFKSEYSKTGLFEFTKEDAKKWDEMKAYFETVKSNKSRDKKREREYINFLLSERANIEETGASLHIVEDSWYRDEPDTRTQAEKIRYIKIFAWLFEVIPVTAGGISQNLRIWEKKSMYIYTVEDIRKTAKELIESAEIIERLETALKGKRVYNTL